MFSLQPRKILFFALVICAFTACGGKVEVVEEIVEVEEESEKKPALTSAKSKPQQTQSAAAANAAAPASSDTNSKGPAAAPGVESETGKTSEAHDAESSQTVLQPPPDAVVEIQNPKPNNPSAPETVETPFEPQEIYVNFKKNCVPCHSNYGKLEQIKAASNSIYRSIYYGRMPLGKPNFKTSAEAAQILNWLPKPANLILYSYPTPK